MKDVIVIGAGVVGTSIAFRLAQGGANVTVIDRGEPGTGTSGSSFAWINANQKTPRSYYDLNFEGLKEHDRLEDELGEAPWLHRGGNLVWTGEAIRYDALCRRVERLQSWGYNVQWLTASHVNRELEPEVQFSGPTMRVAWFPDESWLDGPHYVRSILEKASGHGAEVRAGHGVAGIIATDSGVEVTLDDGQEMRADAVVNAAGPSADRVASLVGRRLPLAPTRGLLVRLAIDRPLLSRLIHSTDVNLRPDGEGYVLLHHDSIDPQIRDRDSVPNDDPLCRELCRRARRILQPLNAGQITETRVGIRPYPRDGVSCVGAVSGIPGYYEAVTHSGVTLGPLIGRLLATEILSGEVDLLLHPFRPDRF